MPAWAAGGAHLPLTHLRAVGRLQGGTRVVGDILKGCFFQETELFSIRMEDIAQSRWGQRPSGVTYLAAVPHSLGKDFGCLMCA